MNCYRAHLIGSLCLGLMLAFTTNAQTSAPASVPELAAALLAAPDEAGRAALLTTHASLVNEVLSDQLAGLGRQKFEQNQFDQAMLAFQLSRQLAEKLGYAKGVMSALTGVGNTQTVRNEFKAALTTYTQMLSLAEREGIRRQQASAQLNLCRVKMSLGDLAGAAEHCKTGLQLAESEQDQSLVLTSLINSGIVARQLGEYEQALGFYRRGLALAEALGEKVVVGRLLNNLGVAYRSMGNETAALRHYQQSLTYAEAAGNQLGIASTLSNISMVQRALGNYTQSLELGKRSLAIAEKLGDKLTISQALIEIGSVQQHLGNYEEALSTTLRSVALAEATGNQLQTAINLVSVGNSYWKLNRFDEARTAYERALSLAEKVNSPFTITVTQARLADYYLLKQDNETALNLSEAAAVRERQTGSTYNLWLSLLRAGVALRRMNQFDKARRYFDESISVIEASQLELAASESNQANYWENRLDSYLNQSAMLALQGQTVEAWHYSERAKARVLRDVLTAGKANLSKSLTPDERQQERQRKDALTNASARLNRAGQNTRATETQRAELAAAREKVRLEYESFQTQIYAAHPELRAQRGQAPLIQFPELVQLLDGQSAALEFSVLNEATYLFVITRATQTAQPEVRSYVLPIERETLEVKISAFRRQLADRDVTFRVAAKQLYELLIKPAQAQLAGKSKIIIVPDGKLWDLPFQALVTPKNQYLIESAAVSYAPSLTVLREMQAQRQRRGKSSGELLAFGNPAFGQETVKRVELAYRDEKLTPLPEAEAEVKALGQLYGANSKVFTKAAAREDRLKAEAANASVLHIATHGVLNDAAPLYSHLALATSDEKEPNQKEDGLLEAWELMQMNLKADLAVLSACETARGRIGAGEGVIGLSWALFVAGVPSTVVSQWKVESSSTRDLMLGFHRNWRNKTHPLSKAEALRQAVLPLLKNPRTDHPFYWAGFVLVGDAR